MWKEEGGSGGEREPLPAAGGRERRRVSRKGEAGRQAVGRSPRLGRRERVFPVSHEVIHRETSDFADLLLCP